MKPGFFFLLLLIAVNTAFGQKQKALSNLFAKLTTAKDTLRVKTLNEIARVFSADNEYDSVAYYSVEAYNLSEKIGWTKGIAAGYANKGLVYYYYGDLEKAEAFFLKALKIYESNGYLDKAIGTLSNLSNISADQMKYPDAQKYIFRALELNAIYPDTLLRVILYSNIARNYNLMLQTQEAIRYVDTGMLLLSIKQSGRRMSAEDSVRANYSHHILKLQLGVAYSKQGKLRDAIEVFKKEWAVIKEEPGARDKLELLEQLSENYNNLKIYDTALNYTQQALEILRKDSILDGYIDIYEKQSEAYAGLKRFEEAYNTHVLFKNLNDSFVNNNKNAAITAMQTKYDAAKKDREILQLNKEKKTQRIITGLSLTAIFIALVLLVFFIRSRKLQARLFRQKEEMMIQEKEIEKKILEQKMTELEQLALRAQMNPHFIFNSLNSVQHFVMNKDVDGVNRYLGIFAALIRQTLNTSSRPLISLDEEIRYLDTYLSLERMKSNNGFTFSITVGENIDRSATFIPGMILQPFVENSIKHGISMNEKEDGRISLHISKNGRLLCLVEDNGIGRQKATQIKAQGAEKEYEPKGMAITMSRIDTFNKLYDTDISVSFEDLKDKEDVPAGTLVKIDFPADMD